MTDDDIVAAVLKFEGGYVNNPADHGGPTNFGITAADLGRWNKLGRAASADEVRVMTREVAIAIYKSWYVALPGFDGISGDKLRLVVVDSGVLYGTGRALRWLQQALGVTVDGVFGDKTKQALADRTAEQQSALALNVLGLRLQSTAAIVSKNQSQIVFLAGWISRVTALFAYL